MTVFVFQENECLAIHTTQSTEISSHSSNWSRLCSAAYSKEQKQVVIFFVAFGPTWLAKICCFWVHGAMGRKHFMIMSGSTVYQFGTIWNTNKETWRNIKRQWCNELTWTYMNLLYLSGLCKIITFFIFRRLFKQVDTRPTGETLAQWSRLDFPSLALELMKLFVEDELPAEELAAAWMSCWLIWSIRLKISDIYMIYLPYVTFIYT